MKNLTIILTVFTGFVLTGRLTSQTCCSGGVPLSGNVGFTDATPKAFQFELSYDYNSLSILKFEDKRLNDNSRRRLTQSGLFKFSYAFNNYFAVDALFSYVLQERRITNFDVINTDKTKGPGDAVILLKYILPVSNEKSTRLQLGIGPKLPLGRHNLRNSNGISLNADLQPGSGSWDLIGWANISRPLALRPSFTFSSSITARINGTNNKYFETEKYKFGNSMQILAGAGDRFTVGTIMMDPSLSFRYRRAWEDKINNVILDNTGGMWLFINPSLGISPFPNFIFNIIPEIPVYSKVVGTQLTPTFRLKFGVYYLFKKKEKITFKTRRI